MRYWLLLSGLLCCAIIEAAQGFPTNPESMPVLLLLKNQTNSESGVTGSGFYLEHKSFLLLVTADHVIFGDDHGTNFQGPALDLISYDPSVSSTGRWHLVVALKEIQQTGNIQRDVDHDIVLVLLGKFTSISNIALPKPVRFAEPAPTGFAHFPSFWLRPSKDVQVGSDVFVFGYPTELGFSISDRPILRKGAVAGRLHSNLLIDSTTFGGTSGGPVVEIVPETLTSTRYYIIGIALGSVLAKGSGSGSVVIDSKTNSVSFNSFYNSGLTVVSPTEWIAKALERFGF